MTDDVSEDPHKLQCVIGMVKNLLQIESLTRIINTILSSNNPDHTQLKALIATKTQLQNAVNNTAKENAISASGSGKRASSNNSLSNIMRQMLNEGFDEAKVNVVDTMMTEVYQEIAKTSARALMNELNMTGDEYARMVAQQSEVIRDQNDKMTAMAEEIRLLKIQVAEYESKRKAKKSSPSE